MKPLPKGYRPLTTEQEVQQIENRIDEMDAKEDRTERMRRLKGSVVHSGDKRTCPACKAGV